MSLKQDTGVEKAILDYRINPLPQNKLSFSSFITLNALTIQDQFKVLSDLPNYHKWRWYGENQKDIRFEQFSSCCSRYPGSPRNRIIQAIVYRQDFHLLVYSVLKNIFGSSCEVPYKAIKEAHTKKHGNIYSNKQKKMSSVEKVTLEDTDTGPDSENIINVVDSVDPIRQVYVSTHKESLFRFYCGELFRHGICKWRILNETRNVVVMNDYDCQTGNFLVRGYLWYYMQFRLHYIKLQIVINVKIIKYIHFYYMHAVYMCLICTVCLASILL